MRLLLFLLPTLLFAEAPWGKDSDLTYHKRQKPPSEPTLLSRVGTYLIEFHQDVISPADGPRSHFYPSSSQYTKESMQKHGFFTGFVLGCDRLMRENEEPWLYTTVTGPEGYQLKYDPVK